MTSSKSPRRSDYSFYAPQEAFIVPLLKQHIERVLSEHLKPIKISDRVLDVGCGEQPFRKQLKDLGYTYTGIDVSQNSQETVDVICKIDQSLPNELMELGSFELIFCTEVMEHVVDWDTAFFNLSQLLSSKGKLFITCPYFYQLHEEPHDFWRPTPYALQHFAKKNNLIVIQQENAGDAWDILGTLLANVYSLPLSRTFQDRLLNRIVNLCKRLLFKLLRDRYIQSHVKLQSPLYMSNIFLCEKQ